MKIIINKKTISKSMTFLLWLGCVVWTIISINHGIEIGAEKYWGSPTIYSLGSLGTGLIAIIVLFVWFAEMKDFEFKFEINLHRDWVWIICTAIILIAMVLLKLL